MDRKRWLAHYPQETQPTLQYPKATLTQFLKETVEAFPNSVAIRFMGKSIRYSDLWDDVIRLAGALRRVGIRKGDRVAVMLPNCPQAVISYYAILYIGGIVVQINPLFMERELTYQLADSGAKVIICLDLVCSKVLTVRKKTEIKHVIVTKVQDYLPWLKKRLSSIVMKPKKENHLPKEEENNVLQWASFIRSVQTIDQGEAMDPDTDLALLQYTGGTTGRAKGVMLTHANLVANVCQCQAWFYKTSVGKERLLAVIPFFHVYGMTVAMNFSIRIAGTLVILPRFDVGHLFKAIQKEKPTIFPGAPTMYIGIVNHTDLKKYDISSIEACISGSAPLPIEIQEKFERLTGGKLVEGYGLTECSPVSHANPIWGRRKNGSIGLPWPDTDAKIVHIEHGEELVPGEIGELIIRGPQVMKGYWNRPIETKEVLKDGWLHTGDLGYMDEEGYFYIVDRKKDVIIAGGFNIYPREVEEVLYEHEAVCEAAVVGVPDPYRGETVKAFIVIRDGIQVREAELDQFCRERLASYKVPRLYEFRSELPKTMVGKVLRRALVEEMEDEGKP